LAGFEPLLPECRAGCGCRDSVWAKRGFRSPAARPEPVKGHVRTNQKIMVVKKQAALKNPSLAHNAWLKE